MSRGSTSTRALTQVQDRWWRRSTGTITERQIDIGNLVTAGSSIDDHAALSDGTDRSPARFRGRAAERRGRVNECRTCRPRSAPTGAVGGMFAGKIAAPAQAINAQARTMRVEVDMPNVDHRLVPGMYVSVAFHLPPRGTGSRCRPQP